jgi:actin-related protein
VKDWDLYEKWLDNIVTEDFKSDWKEETLFLVEAPVNDKKFRMQLVEIFFEKLGGKGLSLGKSSLMTT